MFCACPHAWGCNHGLGRSLRVRSGPRMAGLRSARVGSGLGPMVGLGKALSWVFLGPRVFECVQQGLGWDHEYG